MNHTKLALFLAVLCCLTVWTSAQTCYLASCNGAACPNGCAGCSSANQVQLSEGKISQLCPISGSFCFLGTITNGVCSIQSCDSCSSSDPASCTGCNPVTSSNSNSNHCSNEQCYSMSYSAVSANSPAAPSSVNISSAAVTDGINCVLSSCNSANCPNGCANCAAANIFTIPNDGSAIEICPNNASFCFTGSKSNNRCVISNCDGCANSNPSSCTNCQAINSNNANKDWCWNGNCYHMEYSSASSDASSSSGSGSGTSSASSGGSSANNNLNCALLQCISGDCPDGCENCSKATSITVSDGKMAELCPANGSFCFIATSVGGVCSVFSCTSCGSTADSCAGCQAVTAQNSESNFCMNSLCYHMGYTSIVGGSVGASSSGSNGSNTSSTTTTAGGESSGNNDSLSNNISFTVSSGLFIHVSLFLISFVVGGLVILF